MAKYTIEIRELIKNNIDLFDFDYPIFDEKYRNVLEQRIIDSYYFREIGFETIGRFKFSLRATMQRIMPYYNQLYNSTLLKFDPLLNYQVKEVYSKTITNQGNGVVNSNEDNDENSLGGNTTIGKNKRLFSDTPQGRLTLEETNYVTDITENTTNDNVITTNDRKHKRTNTAETNTTDNANEDFTRTMEGNIGVMNYSTLLADFRNTFIRVDDMIIKELSNLFMGVY